MIWLPPQPVEPERRQTLLPETLRALGRLRNANRPDGIQLPGRSLEELTEALFVAIYKEYGIDFGIKT